MAGTAIFILSIIGSMVIVYNIKKININQMLGRFFRDLSRYKSRKRLFSKSNTSLMHIVLGNDVDDILLTETSTEAEQFSLTIQQLAEMDGRTPDTPIYVSILNKIYDVSEGRAMYEPSKAYHGFVAKDATYCYATGNSNIDCDKEGSTTDLNEEQLLEAKKWIEFYHNHDKYKYVGNLVDDPVDKVVNDAISNDPVDKAVDSTISNEEL